MIKISQETKLFFSFLVLFSWVIKLIIFSFFCFYFIFNLRDIITSTIVSGTRISFGLSGIIIEYDDGSYRNSNILLCKNFIS